MSDFINQYVFKPSFTNCIGAEEEFWTVDSNTNILTDASLKIFQRFKESNIKPELSAHQIESVSKICFLPEEIERSLQDNRNKLEVLGKEFNFKINTSPLPPSDFEVAVFPKVRYLEIAKRVPLETLRKSWITGLHIHIGCADFVEAINLMNNLRDDLPYFLAASARSPFARVPEDLVASERYFRYLEVCKEIIPPYIFSPQHFEFVAQNHDFHEDPKSCWWGIRINSLGTVEVRVFDSQETAAHSAELATLVFARALLYKKGVIKPTYRNTKEEIEDDLEGAAIFGAKYEGLRPWIENTEVLFRQYIGMESRYFDNLVSRLNFD